jgi:hypothetical protein
MDILVIISSGSFFILSILFRNICKTIENKKRRYVDSPNIIDPILYESLKFRFYVFLFFVIIFLVSSIVFFYNVQPETYQF